MRTIKPAWQATSAWFSDDVWHFTQAFLAEVLSKSGVEAVATTKAQERDVVGTVAGIFALQQGAGIIRTHNVAMMQQAVALWRQLSAHNYP